MYTLLPYKPGPDDLLSCDHAARVTAECVDSMHMLGLARQTNDIPANCG